MKNLIKYRIQNKDKTFLNAGQMIIESDGVNILWEVL